jgi:hypothetical protein
VEEVEEVERVAHARAWALVSWRRCSVYLLSWYKSANSDTGVSWRSVRAGTEALEELRVLCVDAEARCQVYLLY